LSLRVRQVPAPCQKVEDENLKNLVLQLAKGSALDIPCACGWLERLP